MKAQEKSETNRNLYAEWKNGSICVMDAANKNYLKIVRDICLSKTP